MRPCYIFLDVDGVLNSLRTCVAFGGYKPEHLDRAAMHLVDHLCGKLSEAGYDPRIVISSTWRMKYPSMGFWATLFGESGCQHTRFVGATDDFRDNEPNRRGREVAAWIERHDPQAPYVALDDDSDFLPGQPLALTSHIWGLGLDEIDQAYHLITGQRLFMSTLRTDSKWKALRPHEAEGNPMTKQDLADLLVRVEGATEDEWGLLNAAAELLVGMTTAEDPFWDNFGPMLDVAAYESAALALVTRVLPGHAAAVGTMAFDPPGTPWGCIWAPTGSVLAQAEACSPSLALLAAMLKALISQEPTPKTEGEV